MVGYLQRFLPRTVRNALRPCYHHARDWTNQVAQSISDNLELVTRRRDPMTPPQWMWPKVGPDDFHQAGRLFFQRLVDLASLKPTDRVLEPGCGIGRAAVHLTLYLEPTARYEGFDVDPVTIRWCQRFITPRFPNFRFQVSDVYNTCYNPKGQCRAAKYRFPYPDRTFDVVCLGSGFTHLLRVDVENYLSEIARVLAPGGRCLVTFFLLNEESRRNMAVGKSTLNFAHRASGCWVMDPAIPESAVAYEESEVRKLFGERGLTVSEPIQFGDWHRYVGPANLDRQDVVVGMKA